VHDARVHAPSTYHKRDGGGCHDGGDSGGARAEVRDLVRREETVRGRGKP